MNLLTFKKILTLTSLILIPFQGKADELPFSEDLSFLSPKELFVKAQDSLLAGPFGKVWEIMGCSFNLEKSIFYLQQGANRGDLASKAYLALLYKLGVGVEKDKIKSKEILEELQEKGYQKTSEKQKNLAYCLAQRDIFEARVYLANQGDLTYQVLVAYAYFWGLNAPKNYEKAFKFYKKAADQGHLKSKAVVGTFLHLGLEAEKNREEGWEILEECAQKKDPYALYIKGYVYNYGINKRINFKKAFKFYKESANLGYSAAQFNLAMMYFEGGDGINPNPTKGFALLEKAADQGHLQSLYLLGSFHFDGMGVEKNRPLSAKLYSKAAEKVFFLSLTPLSFIYQYGLGVKKDTKKALSLIEKLFEKTKSYQSSHYYYPQLAELYSQEGDQRDPQKAKDLIEMGAQKGDVFCQICLEESKASGKEVDEILLSPLALYEKAAHQGDFYYQYLLCYFYYNGIYGEKSKQDISSLIHQFRNPDNILLDLFLISYFYKERNFQEALELCNHYISHIDSPLPGDPDNCLSNCLLILRSLIKKEISSIDLSVSQ